MGLFKALGKLTRSVASVALVPIDITYDGLSGFEDDRTVRRLKQIKTDLEDGYESTFTDRDDDES